MGQVAVRTISAKRMNSTA